MVPYIIGVGFFKKKNMYPKIEPNRTDGLPLILILSLPSLSSPPPHSLPPPSGSGGLPSARSSGRVGDDSGVRWQEGSGGGCPPIRQIRREER